VIKELKKGGFVVKKIIIEELIGRKWVFKIFETIGGSPIRFGQIMLAIEGLSQKVLIDKLREFIRLGLVERKSFNEVPPHTEYSLTDKGKALLRLLTELRIEVEELERLYGEVKK
jgi:DNA-binding HxlR family transcriptional regulator